MLNRFSFLMCFLFVSVLSHDLAFSQTFKDFNQFKQLIQDVILQSVPVQPGEEIEVSLLQFNEQKNLPSCTSPIETVVSQPGLASPSNSVVLKCHDTSPWELFVPVQIKVMTEVLIAARRIMPNEVLSEEDVLLQKRDKFQVYNDYFDDKEQISGLTAAHLILEGSLLSRKNLKKALMVQKNQNINLVLRHGGIEITMAGIAKTDGYLNDMIKVINPSSKKLVDAIVLGPNSAQIEY